MSDHKARELEHGTAPQHRARKETFAERDPLAAAYGAGRSLSGLSARGLRPERES